MEKIKIELRKISKTVAKIEVEHGEKLQILFDAFKVHDQKIDRIEQKLDNHEKIINRHSDEIYYFTTILYFFIFSDVNLETRWSRKYVFLR